MVYKIQLTKGTSTAYYHPMQPVHEYDGVSFSTPTEAEEYLSNSVIHEGWAATIVPRNKIG